MNRDEAREYFKPLTYRDLTEKNFKRLVAILEEHLGKWNRQVLEDRENYGHDNRYYMSIHPHKKFSIYPGTRYNKQNAYIIVKVDNYSVREGISFNTEEFIGFAGWADDDNVKPFISAFKEWVDILKSEKPWVNLAVWTTEQAEYLKQLKNTKPLMGVNIMACAGLTKEQRDNFFNTYFVDEFPENPVQGRLIYLDNKEYMYTGNDWTPLEVV